MHVLTKGILCDEMKKHETIYNKNVFVCVPA